VFTLTFTKWFAANAEEYIKSLFVVKCKMKQWIIIILMLLLVPLVHGAICEDILTPDQECQMLTPELTTCTVYNYTIYNTSSSVVTDNLTSLEDSLYYFNFNQSAGDYLVLLCDGSTREIRVVGEDEMTSLAITVFMLVISIGFFIISYHFRHQDKYVELIIKRSLIVVGIYLFMLNSAVMATLAGQAGLPLTGEMFAYMWVFGLLGNLAIYGLVLGTLIETVKMWRIDKKQERTGGF